MIVSDSLRKIHTVLVMDDTPETIAMMSSLLRGLYRTKVATNGKKAIEIATSDDPPVLILLDIMMPEMDGDEVCRRLKQNEKASDIPIIFLTARLRGDRLPRHPRVCECLCRA